MSWSDEPLSVEAPGYWRYESSGILKPAIEAYLNGEPMSLTQVAAMCAYLRQWINSPLWKGPEIDGLRDSVHSLTNRAQIDRWLDEAMDAGIDPL